eukprot:431497_1
MTKQKCRMRIMVCVTIAVLLLMYYTSFLGLKEYEDEDNILKQQNTKLIKVHHYFEQYRSGYNNQLIYIIYIMNLIERLSLNRKIITPVFTAYHEQPQKLNKLNFISLWDLFKTNTNLQTYFLDLNSSLNALCISNINDVYGNYQFDYLYNALNNSILNNLSHQTTYKYNDIIHLNKNKTLDKKRIIQIDILKEYEDFMWKQHGICIFLSIRIFFACNDIIKLYQYFDYQFPTLTNRYITNFYKTFQVKDLSDSITMHIRGGDFREHRKDADWQPIFKHYTLDMDMDINEYVTQITNCLKYYSSINRHLNTNKIFVSTDYIYHKDEKKKN